MSPIARVPTKISGVTYDDPVNHIPRQDIIRKIVKPGQPVELFNEVDNPADPKAIAVWYTHKGKQYHLGYLNHMQSERVHNAYDMGGSVTAVVLQVTGGTKENPTRGVNIEITMPLSESDYAEWMEYMAQDQAMRNPKKSKGGGCLKVGAALIVFFVVAGIVVALTTDGDTAPTDRTVLVPTVTSVPVATTIPEPTSTPFPTVDAAVREYQVAVLDISESFASAMTKFGEINTEVGSNPTLLFDQDWIMRASLSVAWIQLLCDQIQALEAPEEYAEVQQHFAVAAEHYDLAMVLYTEGVDNFDVITIEKSIDEMELGTEELNIASELATAIFER